MAHYIAGRLKYLNTLLISIINCSSKVSDSVGRDCMWKTCKGNSSTSLGRLVKCTALVESPIYFQQQISWIVPNLQVKSFCIGLPSASPSREATGSCGEGKCFPCTPKTRLQCDVFYQSSIIFFLSKVKKKNSTLEQNCFFPHYLLFGVSLTCLSFLFLAVFTEEYRPRENKLILMPFLGKTKVLQENHFW